MRGYQEVEEKIKETLGDQIALPAGHDYDAELDLFCKDMVKQCELAEKKSSESQEVLASSNILKAQLYGCWTKLSGLGGTHKKAVEAYEKALALGGNEALLKYRMALLHRVWDDNSKAIDDFERVIELKGVDSELGLECAKELEKIKAKKSGCFIATAACGTPLAEEVIWLSRFRDDVLAKRTMGMTFINFYYKVSPPIAARIECRNWAKAVIRTVIIIPLSKLASWVVD